MKILAVGGGSGGHVTPVAAVIEQLKQRDEQLVVRFVCDRAFETQARGIMAHASVPVVVSTITAGKFRRYANLSFWGHFKHWHVLSGNVIDIFKVAIGFLQSLWILLWFRPDVVFAKGGYVCLPVGIAAWCFRRPLVIHDSDTRPGLTNRVLARFATIITTGFPTENYNYDPKKTQYIGVPVKDEFRPVSPKEQARQKELLDIDPSKVLVVAFGGGLGAVSINDAMPALAEKLGMEYVIYNVTGKGNSDRAAKRGEGVENYLPIPFVYTGMYGPLAAADIVITRASATALAELAGLKKPVIAVPARHLSDQIKNAKVFADAEAVVAMTDDQLADGEYLYTRVVSLREHKDDARQLAERIHSFARPDAAMHLADAIRKAHQHR